jgi:chromosome segregation ATPase
LSTAIKKKEMQKISVMMHFNKVSDHLSNMKTTPEQADDRISIEVRLQKQIDDFYFVSKITLNSKIDTLYKDMKVLNINTNNANSVIGGLQSKRESIITEMSGIHKCDPTTIADINAKVEIIEARIATLKHPIPGILDRLTTPRAIVSKLKDRNDDQQKQISSLQAQRHGT